MNNQFTFADSVIEFNKKLTQKTFSLPQNFKIINPFIGEQKEKILKISTTFYRKYYNDNNKRKLILGSSPARRGSAIIGIPFEEANHLQKETGILIDNFYINKSSSNFLFDVMEQYGGIKKFYSNFYMNFVCPLGIVKINEIGKETNFNYYENKELQESLYTFIVDSIRDIINFGIDTSVCYCIGSGENFKFLTEINNKYNFFEKIIPLEHPRFIMQYNKNRKNEFMKKYLDALNN